MNSEIMSVSILEVKLVSSMGGVYWNSPFTLYLFCMRACNHQQVFARSFLTITIVKV